MPGAGCTHGQRAERIAQLRVDRQVQPRQPGIPCEMVYGLYVLSLVNQRLPPSPAQCVSIAAGLSACKGAPGPHDFAVRE